MEKGLIHLYHGDGKGKTTAAIGLAIRAAGSGKNVIFAQFMKDGKSSEIGILKSIQGIKALHGDIPAGFYDSLDEENKEKFALEQINLLDKIIEEAEKQGEGSLLILDEITYPYSWNLIKREKVDKLLDKTTDGIEIVLTGRNPEKNLIKVADYVTEMRCEKHPFNFGTSARLGIEC
ncbi:MAG: cob(I)yrinic acid a,c-diamide adenosyltransferase [Lachnospiraceae bacterium]|nr:cob(I)yrinic acid a,c-diamide adenosyltransferase [Lachnospiraceae bacterium]